MFGSLLAGVAGSLFGNSLSQGNARDQMNFQATQNATAHQREVNDLKEAGLNPILSAGGPGASSGSGAMAQTPQIDLPTIMAVEQKNTQLEQDQQRINIEKANSAAGIAKSLSDAELNKARALTEKSGAFGRYFGADAYNYFSNPQGTFRKGIKLKGQQMNKMYENQNSQPNFSFGGMK